MRFHLSISDSTLRVISSGVLGATSLPMSVTRLRMTRMGLSTVNQILDYLDKKIVVRENVANPSVLEKL